MTWANHSFIRYDKGVMNSFSNKDIDAHYEVISEKEYRGI
jgi:hypothetical protein